MNEFGNIPEVGQGGSNVDQIIATHVKRGSDKYMRYLADEHEGDISPEDVALRNNQISQLTALTAMITAWAEEKVDLKPVIRKREIVEAQSGQSARELFTVRLAKANQPLQRHRPQVQLNLHGIVSARNPEETMDALMALSLQGQAPERVLYEYYRRSTAQTLRINTIVVSKDDVGNTHITPNAGIQFDWRRGLRQANAKGLSFPVGTPHTTDNLGTLVPVADFAQMQRRIYTLSGSSNGS